MKEELTKTKQNHEEQLQLIARKHADEIKNLNSALNGKTDNGTQVSWYPCGIGLSSNGLLLFYIIYIVKHY